MNEELSCTPPEIREIAQNTISNLIPAKSKHVYDKQYIKFEKWCREKKVTKITKNALLAHFELQRHNYKSSTLWSMYSMLRCSLNLHQNVDISKFNKLHALLKQASVGYVSKKSKILEEDNINKFIYEADNDLYLAMKVILIIGFNGACRRDELLNLSTDDIEFKQDSIIISLPKTKNYILRTFAITHTNWIELIKQYAKLRPTKTNHKRFFVTYRNSRCITSPIGINTMGKVSKNIAVYLKLPNPELFTGHCFRRSSATHLANRGGDLLTFKRHGGWKSSTVAEGYVDLH
ncbi:hypothetical protein RN001_001369 [Aquatica leii]|uniref:Tyr recombinase domain-containing protein n=1 Tax=Aquatica leii TaxID=1421715 RepID=A0AAN7PG82_9COLE|nr:hypothetical protein RN001_001369 [Aquatica leii]